MNSNYYFQKQQATEHIHTRLQEAKSHRVSKQGNEGSPLSSLVKRAVPLLVGVMVVILLLSACTTGDIETADANESASSATTVTEMTMADRIHFQDVRDAKYEVTQGKTNEETITMADRIFFQDKRDGYLIEESVVAPSSGWTMADRIRLHDRLWEQNR